MLSDKGEAMAYIFDFDGTLADTELLKSKAQAAAMRMFGAPEQVTGKFLAARLAGFSSEYKVDVLSQEFGWQIDDLDGVLKQIKHEMTKVFEGDYGEIKLMPGAYEGVEALVNAGETVVIASNNQQDHLEKVVRLTKLDRLILANRVLASDMLGFSKPAPEFYQEIVRHVPEIKEIRQCIILDDAPQNMTPARDLGMKAIGFLHPDKAGNETMIKHFKEAGAIAVISGFTDWEKTVFS